jgi:preprotein translocase subunit SecD
MALTVPTSRALSRYLTRTLLLLGLMGGLFIVAVAIWAMASTRTHCYLYRLEVPGREATADDVAAAAGVISARMRELGRTLKLGRGSVSPLPPDRIELKLRSRRDLTEALAWLTMAGRVELRLLQPSLGAADGLRAADGLGAADPEPGYEVKVYRQSSYVLSNPGELATVEHRYAVERQPALTVERFERVTLETTGLSKMAVLTFYFSPEDARQLARLMALNAGRGMAMLIDGEMFFPPKTIASATSTGAIQVQGFFYMPPLRRLVKALDCGSLPGSRRELSHIVE